MTIQYSVNLEDILAFNIYHQTSWPIIKRNLLLSGVIEFFFLIQLLLSREIFVLVSMIIIAFMAVGMTYGLRYPKRVTIICGVLLLLLVALLYFPDRDIHAVISSFPLVIPLFITASWSWVLRKWFIKSFYRGKNDMVGLHEMTIDEYGIHAKCQQSESRHSWALVEKIEQNDKYFFIFLGKLKAHVIPKVAFGKIDEANVFYKKANEFWMSAKQKNA